jgi:vacuolar-type H+-ATPase catalytic subunit A/Vma1
MDEDDDHGHGEVLEARTKITPTDQDVLKATIQMYGCAKNSNVMQATARQLWTEYLTIRQRSSVQQATLTNNFVNVPVANRESAAAARLMTAATSDDD